MDQILTWELIIKSSAILCLPFGLARLHRTLPASIRVTFILAIFAALVVLPVILLGPAQIRLSLPLNIATPAAQTTSGALQDLSRSTRQRGPVTTTATTTQDQALTNHPDTDWSGAFFSLGVLQLFAAAVALVLLLRVFLDYRRCDRFLAQLPNCPDPATKDELKTMQHRLDLNSAITLKTQDFSTSPLAFSPPVGWLSRCGHVIAVPREFSNWTPEQRTSALLHELSHIQRNDCATLAFARSVTALYWWHPLAWKTLRQLHGDMEQACDNVVLEEANDLCAQTYAAQLVTIASTARTVSDPYVHPNSGTTRTLFFMAAQGTLTQRVAALLSSRQRRFRMTRKTGALLTTAVLTSSALIATLGIAAAQPSDHPILPLFKQQASYPIPAKEQKLEGYVVVEFGVDEAGATVAPVVVEQVPASGIFAASAMEAASNFRYLPKREAGKDVAVSGIRNRITYTLDKPSLAQPLDTDKVPQISKLAKTSKESLQLFKEQLEADALHAEQAPGQTGKEGNYFLDLADLAAETQPALAEYFLVRAAQLGTTDEQRLKLVMATTLYHRGAIERAQVLFGELAAGEGPHAVTAASWGKWLQHEVARRALVHDTMMALASK